MLYFFGFTLSCRTTKPGYADTTTSLQIVLNTQRNPYSNQATPKQYLPNFPTPKIPKSKISNHPKSFDHPCYFRSGVPPPPDHHCGKCMRKLYKYVNAL